MLVDEQDKAHPHLPPNRPDQSLACQQALGGCQACRVLGTPQNAWIRVGSSKRKQPGKRAHLGEVGLQSGRPSHQGPKARSNPSELGSVDRPPE